MTTEHTGLASVQLQQARGTGTWHETLPVSEVFGPTVQGEGPAAGRLAVFLRLMGCNLACGWCDTPYTWDGSRFDLRGETTHLTAQDIRGQMERLADGRRPLLVISGGEPLLHQYRPTFLRVLGHAAHLGWPVHVESNGTLAPNPLLLERTELVTLSPKQAHAGEHRGHQDPALHPAWFDVVASGAAILKIVVRNEGDVAEAARVARTVWRVPLDRVWVMPEGTTRAALDYRWPEVAEAAVRHGVNATHRLHVLAWGDERGR